CVSVETGKAQPEDPGLDCLVMALRLLDVGADPKQIKHQFASAPIGIPEMLRFAQHFGLKARAINTRWERLMNTPPPKPACCEGSRDTKLRCDGERVAHP